MSTIITRRRYTIRKPGNGRKTFSIMRDEITSNGRSQETWDDPRIHEINTQFLSGLIGIDEALSDLMDIKEEALATYHESSSQIKISSINKKKIQAFLDKRMKRKLDRRTKEALELDCQRIGAVFLEDSIVTIPRDEIILRLNCLTNKFGKPFKYSVKLRMMNRINGILKMNGRTSKEDDLIAVEDITRTEDEEDSAGVISYILEDDIGQLLKAADTVPNSQIVKDCILILFYTGMREGELFAINRKNWDKSGGSYLVRKQRDRYFILKDPKSSNKGSKSGPRIRNVLVPPKIVEAFDRWCNLDHDELKKLRIRLSVLVKMAAKRAFPNEPIKHVSNHDLRHSAAVNYLSKGFSLTATAGRLGHSEEVCRNHYAGWLATDEEVVGLLKKLS